MPALDKQQMLEDLGLQGDALQFAAPELKGDREIVLAVHRTDGWPVKRA